MHIKQVIIQGFKSFREQTILEPFDPRHNVVVGRNGSGKSNFFQAIQFVISDEYSRLRSDQLQNLLHEGIGPRVVSAYVDIIFDNTDGRLPIDKSEVYIRRLFGSKKDQYFLNKKIVSRNDVMNLLESAGFSKSNPYYIVKQGKINQLATALDSQRLQLLREIAGTRVYDDRCRESKNILIETERKLKQIVELLATIDKRLRILEEEKEELKEYQNWDDKRRCLEYTIYHRELKEAKKKLQDVEVFREKLKPEQKEINDKAKIAQERIRAATKSVKEARRLATAAREERDVLSLEQQEILRDKTKLTLMISDLMEEVSSDSDFRKKAEQELDILRIDIANQEEELEKIKPQYEEIKTVEEECTRELALKEQKRKELYAKLGRVTQFTNRAERDEWIGEELKQLEHQIKDKENHQTKISDDLKNDGDKQILLDRKIKAYTHQLELQTASINNHNKSYEEMTKAKNEYQIKRKEVYRKESTLQCDLEILKDELEKVDRSLRSMVGNATINGRDSVGKVIEWFREQADVSSEVSSYHGLSIDNFDCDKNIYTAIEVTAGNKLFNHMIDTDLFSTKILKEMNNQHFPGEASFIPLNRIAAKIPNYPETGDAIPMIAKINYDPIFDKAFRYIFGRTLICRNLEVATLLARSTGLDCVTMEGDQVSSKGPLTGGYFNSSRSRMETQKTRSKLISHINILEEEMKTLKEEIFDTERNIILYVTQMQKAEIKKSKAHDTLEMMKAEIRLIKVELEMIERCRSSKEQSLAHCASNLKEMNATKEGLESELTQELTSQLSVNDQQQIDTLNGDIRRLTKENKVAFAKRMKFEIEKNKIENLLVNNLRRRRNELVQALQKISIEDKQRKLESSNVQLKEVKNYLVKTNAELKTQNDKVFEAIRKQKAEVSNVEECKLNQKEIQDRIEAAAKDLEKLAGKENIIQQKINETTQKISELEALPSHDAISKLATLSTKQLIKEIEKTNLELKNYSHVNKRALDQFMTFSDQKMNLGKRKAELDIGTEKIKDLMMVLDQRKYEAIQFTFKQVSKYFSEIFEKLVPLGRAELVMQTTDSEPGFIADEITECIDSDKFTGIGIRVSFRGQTVETKEIHQLSGGQKSLVALTLIFAIQKCDPAPFYLFDEIDQALDTQHRAAVAAMIHELSVNAQFITTTFRPELLTHANKFYGVEFRNKVSHIVCVTLEKAADFLEENTTRE